MSVAPSPIEVCAAVIVRHGRLLLTTRPPGSHLAGLWEFPGGKCHTGESLEACIEREIHEELGIQVQAGAHIHVVEHSYPNKCIRLHFLRCVSTDDSVPHPHEGQTVGWFTRSELPGLDLAAADRAFLDWWNECGRMDPEIV